MIVIQNYCFTKQHIHLLVFCSSLAVLIIFLQNFWKSFDLFNKKKKMCKDKHCTKYCIFCKFDSLRTVFTNHYLVVLNT